MSDAEPRREIVFPDGEWLDYWDNRVQYDGGETVTVEVPEDRSPVFVRLGSIIPLDVVNDAVKHGSIASKEWRTLDIYPAKRESSAILWDPRQFPPSAFRDRSFVFVNPSENGVEIRLEAGSERDTILRVWRTQAPRAVQLDDTPMEQRVTGSDWEKEQCGWWFAAADQRLWVRIPGARDSRITIND